MRKFNTAATFVIIGTLITATAYFLFDSFDFRWNVFDYGGYHMGSGMMGHWGFGIMSPIFWGFILLTFVILIGKAFPWLPKKSKKSVAGPDPVEILKKRYARG